MRHLDSGPSNRDEYEKTRLSAEAHIMNSSYLTSILFFYHKISKWIFSLINQQTSSVPRGYAALPEYIFEDMTDFLMLIYRFSRNLLSLFADHVSDILRLFIYLLSYPQFCRNPYVRTKFIEFLAVLTPVKTLKREFLPEYLTFFYNDKFVIDRLVFSAVNLFVDIESNATDSQFGDKFNVRYSIMQLIKQLMVIVPQRKAISIADDIPLIWLKLFIE
jgi:hypothetical protein